MANASLATVKPTFKAKKNSELLRVLRQLSKNKGAMIGLTIFLIEVIIAILAPYIIPYSYTTMDMTHQFATPSLQHLFGCDDVGRDIFSRVIYGSRYSISLGILATIFAYTCGIIVGSTAGYFGGRVDNVIMRFLDIVQAMPGMLLMIVMCSVLGTGFVNTILAMGISSIPGAARMCRAQMLKERENEYIEASKSINCSKVRIIASHLLPNCMSPLIVGATMGMGTMITTASGLSFIGLGVQPPIPEWGAMLSSARAYIRQAPHLVIFPGVAIAITVLSLNLLGDGLRDALDPKLKK